ncbi:MAG: hypothetical protein ACW99Q_17565 [Candidatus Kariarchaeaceae archaeon]|jgi:hypothetical protein
MNVKRITISVGIILLIVLSLTLSTYAKLDGEKVGNSILIETDTLAVEIKGGDNVPYFFFWHQEAANLTYNLHLDRIFEVEDLNDNGIYDTDLETEVSTSRMNLASLNWEFSEFETVVEDNITKELHFNLTSTDSNAQPNQLDPMVQFRIHLNSSNDAELKFDVVIGNYEFVSDTAMLVVGYKITNSENREMKRNNDTVSFGQGYFQYEENATCNATRNIQVGLSTNTENSNPMIFLSYEHFDGLMVHDPIIGVYEDIITTDQNSGNNAKINLPELSRDALFASTVLATLVFILVPSVIYSRRRTSSR